MATHDVVQIKRLIERWASAVHAGDMDAVLADHCDDIVMFDVPPPHEGVRGIDAYQDTWPPFFLWQAAGASFEITSLEVVAGDDVAFAYALLRCGTPQELERNPDSRLRLTIGLRKENGRWVVTHEHHSFPSAADSDEDATAAEQEVLALHRDWFDRTAAKDLEGLMAHIADDVVSYEHDQPLQYLGVESVRTVCKRGLEAATGAVSWDVPDLQIIVHDGLAVAWGLNRMRAQQPNGTTAESWSRGTRVFRKANGAWSMIHQHLSYPHDPETGAAKTDLRP
jgi:uncharacterized protein (TIGR02246 family)